MPDDRIYDAINLFKYSPTGQGSGNIPGDPEYRRKYHLLAVSVQNELWRLWSANEIGYAHIPGLIGDSQAGRAGRDIRVSNQIEPSSDPARYPTPVHQGRLAATSCNLVHEATHMVSPIECYPEEETLCRMLQGFYFHDLSSPRQYHSRVTGTLCTAEFLPNTPFHGDWQQRRNRTLSQDMIDSVLGLEEYRRDLETDSTARFIVRSLSWWGGLRNRWPGTLGYYLRSLASRQDHDYSESILQILESLTAQTWQVARTCAGNIDHIGRALSRNRSLAGRDYLTMEFSRRVMQIQQVLGEKFLSLKG
jgi:hypothetical protein